MENEKITKQVVKTNTKGIFKDVKTGKYLIQTTFTTKDGFRKKVCLRGFESERKALEKKMQLFIDFQNSYGDNINSNEVELLIDEYIKYKSKKIKISTLYNDQVILKKYLLPIFKKTDDFTIPKINELSNIIYNVQCKNSTKNSYISRILSFIKYLDLFEKIDYHVFKKFKQIITHIPEVEKPKNDFIELEDLKKFVATFGKNEDVLKLFFITLFFTGARKTEILALQYKDISFEDNTIYIHQILTNQNVVEKLNVKTQERIKVDGYYLMPYTKTNTTKLISVPIWIIELFQQCFKAQNANDDDFVFKNKNGKLFATTFLQRHYKKHLQLAGIKEIKIHDLRHSHTTMLYDLGCDGKYVAERLGHVSEKTSKTTYQHLTDSKKQANDGKILGITI